MTADRGPATDPAPISTVHGQAANPETLVEGLAEQGYLADRGLATVLAVAVSLGRPLLLEGEAGVGKTELAKALAAARGSRLIRLQCYEGIDVSHALYDWNYARQMLYIRTLEADGADAEGRLAELFGTEFLIRRPLLEAIDNADEVPPVLLIDEIDRADDEFEAFLLEVLSDFQVTIPEVGTIEAKHRPIVIITSNRTRELHDALKRRCLYHWLDHPSPEREAEIIMARVPSVSRSLAEQASRFIAGVRRLDLIKAPGVAEAIDWTEALRSLGSSELDEITVEGTLGAVLKHQEDLDRVREGDLGERVAVAREAGESGG